MTISALPGQALLIAVLPMSPSVNAVYHPAVRKIKGRSVLEEDRYVARTYKDPRAVAYALQVKSLLNYCTPPWRVVKSPLIQVIRDNSAICLDFEVREFFKTKRKNDIDNRVKVLQDALCDSLGLDDSRIIDSNQKKRTHKECEECVVVILRVAKIPDIWQEQAELDELIESYRRNEEEKEIAENRINAR
jgi:Holliday junction resolvase RusA-like endonuclease